MNDVMPEWECWFQIDEQGAGGFRKLFAAQDKDQAWDWAESFAIQYKANQNGNIFPVRDSLKPYRPLV